MRIAWLLVVTGLIAGSAPACVADGAANDIPLYVGQPGLQIGDVCVNPTDGAVMVWVPAGEFLMGSTDEQVAAQTDWALDGAMDATNWRDVISSREKHRKLWAPTFQRFFANEMPQRSVYLDGYWMYKQQVTVAQYRRFCEATKRKLPKKAPVWGWRDDSPMVNPSSLDAAAYATWAHVSVPTEAQWEKAARGTDGRVYPWGNTWDASKVPGRNAVGMEPVGSYPAGASPYGCMDMVGGVREWCADWYDPKYYSTGPVRNPTGPPKEIKWGYIIKDQKMGRVMRGGASVGYNCVGETFTFDDFRCAKRKSGPARSGYNDWGFRCATTP